MPDGKEEWTRGEPRLVSQAWMDNFRNHLPADRFLVEDDELPTTGKDGIPDRSWKVKDIRAWLSDYNMNPKGYATKTSLLSLVNDALNPAKAEEVVAEAEEQAEVPEDLAVGEPDMENGDE
jgi:hypothetical protein